MHTGSRRRRWLFAAALVLFSCFLAIGSQSQTPSTALAGSPPKPKHKLDKGPIQGPPPPSKPLPKPDSHMPDVGHMKAAAPQNPDPVDLKVLVISADGTEVELPAITQILDELGTPYDVYVASQNGVPKDGLALSLLIDPNNSVHAFYEGVILTTGSMYCSACTSNGNIALMPDEWANLVTFESTFGIRQMTWYTYPTPDYGFNTATGVSATPTSPVKTNFTVAGAPLFSGYVNTSAGLSIPATIDPAGTSDWVYLATPLTNTAAAGYSGPTTAVLQDASGNALAAIHTYSSQNNRQNLAFTFDSNASMTHNLVLAYGAVNWVTQGLFLGERHIYLAAQPDDLFIDDHLWLQTTACTTPVDDTSLPIYRLTSADMAAYLKWQNSKQAGTSAGFKTEFPFNGVGTTSDYYTNDYSLGDPGQTPSPVNGATSSPLWQKPPKNDNLTQWIQQNQASFRFINHTYHHENLDATDYATTSSELTQNNQVASQLKLSTFNKANLVTPDISGIGESLAGTPSNPAFLQAAYDAGIRQTVGNTSIEPTLIQQGKIPALLPNTGYYLNGSYVVNGTTKNYSLFVIPRHPNNLYYDVATPQQWLAQDNCLYPAGVYGNVTSYSALLSRESSQVLSSMLKGDIDPQMFHQPNLYAYDGTHSVLGDLIDATLTKYNSFFVLPIQSLPEDQIATRMLNRMAYNAAGVKASVVPGTSITLTATQAALVPVTGLSTTTALPSGSTKETYGGQTITWVKLAAGQSVTLQQSTWQGAVPNTVTHFSLTAPTSAVNGSAITVTVQALNAANAVVTGYTGTVHFTSSDAQAILPANSTLTNGAGSFSVTLKTNGSQTITVTDAANSSLTGSATVSVGSSTTVGPVTHFSISAPASVTVGATFNATVKALDANNNVVTTYTGKVSFDCNNTSATTPADYTFKTTDAGQHSFSFALGTKGTWTISVTDYSTGATGSTSVTAS